MHLLIPNYRSIISTLLSRIYKGMKYLQLFESFSSEPIRYKVRIYGCVPDGGWDAPGYWPIYHNYVIITLPEDIQDMAGTTDLFSIDLTDAALKALIAGDFETEVDPEFIQQIPEAKDTFGRDYLIALAEGSSSLEEFGDELQEQLYDVVSDWYQREYGEDAEDEEEDEEEEEEDEDDYDPDHRVNDAALREIMFDDFYPRITRASEDGDEDE